jgi:aarF domain-containing kinase
MTFSTVLACQCLGAQQWASQKCSQWLGQKMTPSLTPIALAVGSRRHICSNRCWNYVYNWRNRNDIAELEKQRQHRLYYNNLARLYARRILETAAASAAVQRVVTDLEVATTTMSPPVDWHNWQKKEWSQELLDSLGDTKLMRLWEATRRLANLAFLAAPILVLYPLSLVSDTVEEFSWKYALWGIEQAGPTYVKLVQWATTRQDLFSPEFCRYFGKLQDNTVGHKWEETVRILQEDLGLQINPEQLNHKSQKKEGGMLDVNEYLELDHNPIGSGCIAQVYRGRLKQAVGQFEKGTEVAVKVQHPGIWYKVCVDFYIMGKVAQWLEGLPWLNLQYLSLSDSVRKFRDVMLPQLDLTLESKHLTRFNRDFSNEPAVAFPHPVNDLTSTRVLTETFIRGRPILEYTTASEAVRKELAYAGLEVTLKMIFLHDFLHGKFGMDCIIERQSSRQTLTLTFWIGLSR